MRNRGRRRAVAEPSKRAIRLAETFIVHQHYCRGFDACTCGRRKLVLSSAEAIDAHAAEMVAEERRRWMAILRHHHNPDDKPRPIWKWRLYILQIARMGESGDWPEGVDRG
jgi:hypothetical protein